MNCVVVFVVALALLTAGTSSAEPAQFARNGDFAEANAETHAPLSWSIGESMARVKCKADSTPTDGCALVVRGKGNVEQYVQADATAGDTLGIHIDYRTTGAYSNGVVVAQIDEVLHIGGSYVEATEQAKRKIVLRPSSEWAQAAALPYTVVNDTFFSMDPFAGRDLAVSLRIRNKSTAGKLIVDRIAVTVTPPETP